MIAETNIVIFFDSITQATDTRNIRLVFVAITNTILKNALEETGIL
jgi:hypothetical protein